MKKLFLYIILLSFLFISTFYISKDIFDNEMKAKQQTTEQLTEQQSSTEDKINVTNSMSNSAIFLEENNSLKKNITMTETDEKDEDNYIVGIKNDYVIVYKNSLDCIFEYTGIDAQVIKCVNPTLYQKIYDHIEFDNKEELFDFLQSLAS